MEQEINDWINTSHKHSKWLADDKMMMYVRWCKVKGIDSMVIATVEVKEEYQNKGVFKGILDYWEKLAASHGRLVVVENVHNHILYAYLIEKRGYYMIEGTSCAKKL